MDIEYLKSECRNSQFHFDEFKVSDISELIELVERLQIENKQLKEENEDLKFTLEQIY